MTNSLKIILTLLIATLAPTGSLRADGASDYQRTCAACHNLGVAGAPRVGEAALWEDRVEKGIDTLVKHAINGFAGDEGVMPPKGGFSQLSDEQVRAIVEYMVSQVE